MIQLNKKELPSYAYEEISRLPFREEYSFPTRRCIVYIAEQDAVTYIDPESFDFSDVYGNCELCQQMTGGKTSPIIISKFEFKKNERSMEKEAERELSLLGVIIPPFVDIVAVCK